MKKFAKKLKSNPNRFYKNHKISGVNFAIVKNS